MAGVEESVKAVRWVLLASVLIVAVWDGFAVASGCQYLERIAGMYVVYVKRGKPG